MNRRERYFDTQGHHPYERTHQEVEELTVRGGEQWRFTKVVYIGHPPTFEVHPSPHTHPYVLEELTELIQDELIHDFEMNQCQRGHAPIGFWSEKCPLCEVKKK